MHDAWTVGLGGGAWGGCVIALSLRGYYWYLISEVIHVLPLSCEETVVFD
jgi:hypothetical protein